MQPSVVSLKEAQSAYNAWGIVNSLFGKKSYVAVCGHETVLAETILVGDKPVKVFLHPDEGGHIPFCVKCIGEKATLCCQCGRPIVIGEPIARYGSEVGCMRGDCVDTGPRMSGYLISDGSTGHVDKGFRSQKVREGVYVVGGFTNIYGIAAEVEPLNKKQHWSSF